ncbi:FdtA/QdtA family cupin domain-containing protein [Francisella philomiragia]
MTYKQVLTIIHKFIPRFIREQFINDAIAQYSHIKRLNKDAILSAEKAVIEESIEKEFTLVSNIEETGCSYELLLHLTNRNCSMSGATLVIGSKEYKKDNINTILPDISIYMLNNVSVVGRTNLIINDDKFYSFDLNEMHSYHEIKNYDVINKSIFMYEIIGFCVKGDRRGSLVSLEQNKNIPFDIRRVYYIFNTKTNARRGFHAHRNLKQVLVCVSGSCKVLIDDGVSKENVLLNSPDKGLLISGVVWREMFDFSKDCVLLVLASELYDESDYIRDYDKFIKEVRND